MTLRKSLSLFILGTATAFTMPSQLPSADNGYSISASAEAAFIRRGKLKKKQTIGYRAVVKTSVDPQDTEAASSVISEYSYIDASGNLQPLETVTMNSPKKMRAEYVWTPPADFESGKISVSCDQVVDIIPDVFIVIELSVSSEPDDGTKATCEIEGMEIQAWRKDNGKIKVDIVGKTEKMSAFADETQTIQVNGENAKYKHTERIWKANLSPEAGGEELDDATFVVSTTALGEFGTVLDQSTTSFVLDEDANARTTDEIFYSSLKVNDVNELDLVIVSEPIDPLASATSSAMITAEDFGADLFDIADVKANAFREFSFEALTFEDPNNVIDMEYGLDVTAIDASGNILAEYSMLAVGTDADTAYIETDKIGENVFAYSRLEMNEDQETFSFYLSIEGEIARQTETLKVTLLSDSGGSEADPQSLEMTESIFVNYWIATSPLGPEATEIALASNNISFALSSASDGNLQDISGGATMTSAKPRRRRRAMKTAIASTMRMGAEGV